MPTIRELYENLEKHKLELKRYPQKNGDDKKKRSLALNASSSFNNDEDELDEFET